MVRQILASTVLAGLTLSNRAEANFNAANQAGTASSFSPGGIVGSQGVPILGAVGASGAFETLNLPALSGGELSLPEVPGIQDARPVEAFAQTSASPEWLEVLAVLPSQPSSSPNQEKLPGFYAFWTSVVRRVLDKVEGTLTHTTGFLSETTTYAIERTGPEGVFRRMRIHHLWVRSRRPGTIDDFHKWWVVFERQSPPEELTIIYEADEMGGPVRGDPRDLEQEFLWWKANLAQIAPSSLLTSNADQVHREYSVEFRRFIDAVLERAKIEGSLSEWSGPKGTRFREAFLQRMIEEHHSLVRRIRVFDQESRDNFKRTVRFTEPFLPGSERRAITYETDGDGNGVLENPRFAKEVAWWRAQMENGQKSEIQKTTPQ